jgi:hypothetical protein
MKKVAYFIAILGLVFCGCEVKQRTVRDIPSGFDFPACRLRLKIEQHDLSKIRLHAWRVFAGLTQFGVDGRAVFETWYSRSEALAAKNAPTVSDHWLLPLEPSRQLLPQLQLLTRLGDPHMTPVIRFDGVELNTALTSVAFNQAAYQHIRDKNLFEPRTKYDLLAKARSPKEQIVPLFPSCAIAIKAIWWPIRQVGYSVVPVWDNLPTRAPIRDSPEFPVELECCNDFHTWRRFVAIDPGGLTNVKSRPYVKYYDYKIQNFHDGKTRCENVSLLPISRLFTIPLSSDEVARYRQNKDHDALAAFDALFKKLYPGEHETFVSGDSIALVGLHVATKELEDWVWSTFWWHDMPDAGVYAADRSDQVQGVWRNYLMDVTVDTDDPPEPDGTPNITFNPWLEAGMSNGLVSNCMACHQMSAFPVTNEQVLGTVIRGRKPIDAPYFLGTYDHQRKIRLDYIWSLRDGPIAVGDSQHPTSSPSQPFVQGE